MKKRLWMTMALLIGAGLLVGQNVQDSLLRSGRLAYQSGDYSKAILCYRTYLNMAKQVGDDHATADALRLIGDAFRASGDPKEALSELAQGLAIANKIADSAMVGRIQNRIAAVRFEMADLPGTEQAANIALNLSSKANDQATLANTLNILGAAYRQDGHAEQALAALSRSVTILRALGDTTDVPNALNNMANTLLSLHEYDAAIDTALHSYAMAASMNIVVYEQYAAQVIYTAYRAKGSLDKTVVWMERYMNHTYDLTNQAHSKEMSSLRLEMEATRQEQENERLKTENALQQQTIANQNGRALAIGGAAVFALILMVILGLVARRQRKQVSQLRAQNLKIELQSREISSYNAQLQAVAQEREQQQKRLVELHGVKDKLFSIISHDLRSPLNSIQGMLNIYEGGLIDQPKFATMASRLKTRVDGTTLLLDNLLNWSRSQMEGFVVHRMKLDLGGMVEQECNLQATSASAKQIVLENLVPPTTETLGDKTMIELVLRNLLSNAIKFTEAGGRVQILLALQGNAVHVGVCDNGIGVPPSLAPKVLGTDYFSTMGTAQEKGSGLGLRLCREFLVQNGGDLWLTHNNDKGTTFWFSLQAI